MQKLKEQTLRELRIHNEKNASEIATVLGVAVSSYYNYENGVREINNGCKYQDLFFDAICNRTITRPPQSWCYVEELSV